MFLCDYIGSDPASRGVMSVPVFTDILIISLHKSAITTYLLLLKKDQKFTWPHSRTTIFNFLIIKFEENKPHKDKLA